MDKLSDWPLGATGYHHVTQTNLFINRCVKFLKNRLKRRVEFQTRLSRFVEKFYKITPNVFENQISIPTPIVYSQYIRCSIYVCEHRNEF